MTLTGTLGSRQGAIARDQMVVGMRSDRNPITQIDLLVIFPALPIKREPKPPLCQMESTNPCTDRINHFAGKIDRQRPASSEQHSPLKQGWESPDMIDMPMCDEHGIQRAYKIPAITQQMNTRLPSVDE